MQQQAQQVDYKALEKLRAAYQKVFKSEEGKKVLEDLKQKFHFKSSTIGIDLSKKVDPNATLYNEGQRSAICIIEQMIDLDIEAIRKRQAEQKNKSTGGLK